MMMMPRAPLALKVYQLEEWLKLQHNYVCESISSPWSQNRIIFP